MAHNNTVDGTDHADHHQVELIIVFFLCALCCLFNLLTVIIMFVSKKLRRPANYPVSSFILMAAIQVTFAAPLYLYRRLEQVPERRPPWVCDFYRLPYFLCPHIMKVSLLITSFDRLVAIKYPYRYQEIFTKKSMSVIILFSWIVIIAIDSIPFFPINKTPDDEGCHYLPSHKWGITVIFFFNILPFLIIAVNYTMLWKVAAKMTFKDLQQQESAKTIESNAIANDGIKKEEVLNNNNIDTSDDDTVPEFYLRQASYKTAVKRGIKTPSYDRRAPVFNSKASCSSNTSCISLKQKRKMLRLAFEMKATKTSLMLLAIYLLCWGPLGAFYLIDNFCLKCMSADFESKTHKVRMIVKILSFLSSPLAPLVYCWRTREFRHEMYKLLCKKQYIKRRSKTINQSLTMEDSRKYAVIPLATLNE